VPEDALPNGMVLVSLEDLQSILLLSPPDAENSSMPEADGVARGHRWVGSERGWAHGRWGGGAGGVKDGPQRGHGGYNVNL
jgi:hypothetical protein